MLFFKHIWLYVLIAVCLICTFPIMPSDGWFSVSREIEINRAFYGEERHSQFVKAAQARFNWLFVRSGAYQTSVDLAAPDAPDRRSGPHREFINPNVSGWAEQYVRHFWEGILRALYRWEVNQHWYVLVLIGICVGVNEGLGKRQINTAKTLYVSPANFHLAAHFLIAKVLGALLVLPWLPIAMTWYMWIIAIAVMTKFWTWATISLPSLKPQRM